MIVVVTYKVALVVMLAVAGTFSGTSAYFYQQRAAELNGQVSQLQSDLSQLQARNLRTLAVQLLIMERTTVSSQYGEWGVAVLKQPGPAIAVIFPFAFTPQGEFKSLTRVILSVYYLPGPSPSCTGCYGFSTAFNGARTAMVPIRTFYQLNLSTVDDPSYMAGIKTGVNLLQMELLTPTEGDSAVIYIAKITITIEYQSLL